MQIRQLFKNSWFWLVFILLFCCWFFTRFYNLDQSYFFFSDAGRDAWEVYKIAANHELTLLGPGTSYLPFNLSPLYFYLLVPFFVLSGQSYFYSQIALFVFTWLIFTLIAVLVYRKKALQTSFLLLIALFCFSPLVIAQSRSVWNPSFVWPCLTLSIFSIFLIPRFEKKWTNWFLILSGLSLALAVTFNLSVIPTIAGLFLITLWFYRRRVLFWVLGFGGGLLVFNSPLILFEIKYHFQMTRRIIETLASRGLVGQDLAEPLMTRLANLTAFILSNNNQFIIVTLLVFALFITFFFIIKNGCFRKYRNWLAIIFGLLITLIFTLAPPVKIESHYVFGVLTFFFFSLAFWPKAKYFLSLALILFWLITSPLTQHFRKAPRTVAEFESCLTTICQKTGDQPFYYAVQSIYSPWHNDLSYQFGLTRAGCNVKQIATEPNSATTMLIFEENKDFTLGADDFYELNLFGPATVSAEEQCSDSLKWQVLTK